MEKPDELPLESPGDYEWLGFEAQTQEICYLSEFLAKDPEILNYSRLDIDNPDEFLKKPTKSSVSNIIKDQYLRILKYGNISSVNPEKSPVKSLGKDDYDLNDSFIDDSELDQGLIKMEVFQAGSRDYFCCEGGLLKLFETSEYKNRINDLEQIRKFTVEDKKIYLQKKRGRPRKKTKRNRKDDKLNEKTYEIIEPTIAFPEEQKQGFLYLDNMKCLEVPKEEGKARSQTSSVKKIEGKPKSSMQTKGIGSVKRSSSKRKRDSMVNRDKIFNANHPTLSKFKK